MPKPVQWPWLHLQVLQNRYTFLTMKQWLHKGLCSKIQNNRKMLANKAAVGTHGIKLQRIAIHLSAVTWSTVSHVSHISQQQNVAVGYLWQFKKSITQYDNLLCFNLLSNTSVVLFFLNKTKNDQSTKKWVQRGKENRVTSIHPCSVTTDPALRVVVVLELESPPAVLQWRQVTPWTSH